MTRRSPEAASRPFSQDQELTGRRPVTLDVDELLGMGFQPVTSRRKQRMEAHPTLFQQAVRS